MFDEWSCSDCGALAPVVSTPRATARACRRGCAAERALLERHVRRSFNALPDQAQKRLSTLAVSTGIGVEPADHERLLGALALIAEAEGTLELEQLFAELYLDQEWVCQMIAEQSRSPGAARKSQYKLKKRAEKRVEQDRSNEEREASLEAVMTQKAIAIDGEGVTLDDGSHVYRYMAAMTSDGTVLAELEHEDGFYASEAIGFLTSLPKVDPRGVPYLGIFGYGLGYDQTKWFQTMKNKALFELYHASGMEPAATIKGGGGMWSMNFFGRCLRIIDHRAFKGQRLTYVWDILKAFQAKFVTALEAWKIGTEHLPFLTKMKDARGSFNTDMQSADWKETKRYCRLEGKLLAELVETYVRAHSRAGIDLRGKYHGAGSTGEAVLRMMNADEHLATKALDERGVGEGEMFEVYTRRQSAFSRAFFGGRAEVSRLGPTGMRGEGFEVYDIASAYPHALYELPCAVHGEWRCIEGKDPSFDRLWRSARYACIRYELESPPERTQAPMTRPVVLRTLAMGIEGFPGCRAWGPLPYRTEKGSIVFAEESPGGWAWRPELLAALRNVEPERLILHETWILESACKCGKPFQALGDYYLQRLEWGKEGPGIVLKLGMNSCYGKTAQTVGNPKYACRVLAGMITATTRSRLLDAITTASDPWGVMYVATDGILTDLPIFPPEPKDNDTKTGAGKHGKAMLGGWEHKHWDMGVFLVQPGFYFVNHSDVTFVIKQRLIKTRGTHQDIVLARRESIMHQWAEEPLAPVKGMPPRTVFRGVKTSILPPKKDDGRYRRKKAYGRWVQEEHAVKYVINPKRSSAQPVHTWQRLYPWQLSRTGENPLSAEYKKDLSYESLLAQQEATMRDEQPDFFPGDGGPVE